MHEPSIPEALSNRALLGELLSNSSLLIQRQVQLAKLELRSDLERGKSTAKFLGSAGALLYGGILFLLVAAALGIGQALDGRPWAGALVIAAILLTAGGIAGALGWARRIRKPLERSRREFNQELAWTRRELS